MNSQTIQQEINSLPTHLKKEVLDFVLFLKFKMKSNNNIKSRKLGVAKGKIKLADDFNAPIDEFKDYM
jgi:hypothetical protein